MSARETKLNINDGSSHYLFSESGFLRCTPDKKHLLAICSDGMISGFNDCASPGLLAMNEYRTSPLIMDKINLVTVSNNGEIVVALNEGTVQMYKIDFNSETGAGNGIDEIVTRCVGAVTALSISPSGHLLCCAGQDNTLKLINLKGKDYPILAQIPASHFIKAISFNQTSNQFVMVEASGTIRIYSIVDNDPAPQLLKTLIPNNKCDREGNFQISWSEKFVSILLGSQQVRIIERDSWAIQGEFYSQSNGTILSFELLSNRIGLLTGENSGISILSVERNKIICSSDFVKEMQSSSIAGINEEFACIFDKSNGSMYEIGIEIRPEDFISDKKTFNLQEHKKNNNKSLKETKSNNSKIDKLRELKKKKKTKYFEDTEADEEEEETLDSEEGEEEEEDDEGIEDFDSDLEDNNEDLNDPEDLEDLNAESEYETNNFKSISPSFAHPIVQPSSTPWRNLQRYLCYNNVGFITVRSQLENETIFNYDIEFMDRSQHKPIRFSEEISYSLASLSEHGAIFSNSTSIHYISFENSRNSWTLQMANPQDSIILVALCLNGVCTVNNRGILNIYSLTGLLKASVTCPGRPVSLISTSTSTSSTLFLFTSDSEGISCYRINSQTGSASTLSSRVLFFKDEMVWCGISYTGLLGVFTKAGRLLVMLTKGSDNRTETVDRWTEFLDTSESLSSKGETAWPVYFDINILSVVTCKLVDSFPDPYPTPIITDIPFKMPQISKDSLSVNYEESLRCRLLLTETEEVMAEKEKKKLSVASDRHLLEMAQLSIKSEKAERLVELARLACTEKTIDLLIQMAKHYKLISIVDELEGLKEPTLVAALLESTTAASVATVSTNQLSSSAPINNIPTQENVLSTPLKTVTNSHSNFLTMSELGLIPNSSFVATSPMVELIEPVSSPVVVAPVSSNPFAKSSASTTTGSTNNNNVMLDYISAMMKMNTNASTVGGGNNKEKENNKRKIDENISSFGAVKKSSTLSTSVTGVEETERL